MTEMMNNRVAMKEAELDNVNGGTFTSNMFFEEEYNSHNIKTNYHFFKEDEFQLPDGTWTNEKGANEYMKKVDPKLYEQREMAINMYSWCD